ncbi:hypothetical protein JVU11DRAFT_8854 [Chiua virens]|nr:hypothetical protein JVU11DRAFT_8854 [Chiua virens]
MTTQPNWPALHGVPVIQRRVSIARPPAPPIEDSDIIVLNSRSTLPDASAVEAKVLYLDLRLSIPDADLGGLKINWAFAGLRETIPLEGEEENAVQYHWGHAIDSHGRNELPDKGTMVKCKDDGGENIEIETGVGVDPDTGKSGPYEEVWMSEHIPLGTPFAFVVSSACPNRSTRFMAVLGPHAIGLCRTSGIEIFAAGESQHLHAVRLRNDNQGSERTPPTFRKVFSTGYRVFEDQLEKFVEALLAREMKGEGPWQRGERLILGYDQGKDSTAWAWTVWDAGHIQS